MEKEATEQNGRKRKGEAKASSGFTKDAKGVKGKKSKCKAGKREDWVRVISASGYHKVVRMEMRQRKEGSGFSPGE